MGDESAVQYLCDEATCPICLEDFKKPVMADCGHNFCHACITQCWKDVDRDASCPQCREIVQPQNLKPNRPLAGIVQIARKFRLQMAKGAEALGKVCEGHQEPLKLFCEDDQALICVVCDKSKEHRMHKVIPKEEAFEEYKAKILNHLEFLNKQRGEMLSFKLSGEAKGQKLLEQTETERQKIMAEFKQLHQFLEDQECLLLSQLGSFNEKIENYRSEHIAKLSEEIASVNNHIKEMEEKQKQPVTEFLQDIRSFLQRFNENKFVATVAFPPGLKEQIEKFSETHPFLETAIKEFKGVVLSGPQKKKDLTFPTLMITKDCEALSPQTQSLFNFYTLSCWFSVMGVERITTGTHSWVVDVGYENFWAVGVIVENLRGHGIENLNDQKGIWAIARSFDGPYYSSTSPGTFLEPSPLFQCAALPVGSRRPQRIHVSVNYEERSVTFSDADSEAILFTFKNASFSGRKICSWFSVGK